jgi:histone chaperone ASF1
MFGAHARLQADPPKWQNIPQDDILGVTVILLTCAYNGQEFIRVGYYVNNEYADEAMREAPPASVDIERVARNILAEKPRVTRFPCAFDSPTMPAGEEFGGAEGAEGITTAGFDNGATGFGYAMPAMTGMGMETSQDGMGLGTAMMV